MNEKTLQALRSKNSITRRQAITQLARQGDESAIKHLAHTFRNDPEPDLRELARQAAKQIRDRLQAIAEAEQAKLEAQQNQPQPANTQKLKGAEKRRVDRVEEERTERVNLWLFGIFVAIVAAGLIWVAFGQILSRITDQVSVEQRLANAPALPNEVVRFDGELQGNIYRTDLGNGNSFVIVEPHGTPPAGGWSLVVGIYANATNALGALTRPTSNANALLVVPQFSVSEGGFFDFAAANQTLKGILDRIVSTYPLSSQTRAVLGFGVGANFVSRYTLLHPQDFTIIGLSNGDSYQEPTPNMGATYIVYAGQNAPAHAQAAISYIGRLQSLNRNIHRSQVLAGVGSEEIPQFIEASFERIRR